MRHYHRLIILILFISACSPAPIRLERLFEKFSNSKLPLVVKNDFTYEYGEWEWSSDMMIKRSFKSLDSQDLQILNETLLISNKDFYSRQVALKKFIADGKYQFLLFTRDWIARNQEKLAHEDDIILVLVVINSSGCVTDKIIIGRDRPEQLLITSELDQNLVLKIRTDSIPLIGEIKTSHEIYRFYNGKFINQPSIPLNER